MTDWVDSDGVMGCLLAIGGVLALIVIAILMAK